MRFDVGSHAPPCIMGIINVTPDSFSDGGESLTVEQALRRAAQHVAAGAQILDIGGESSRPGAAAVDAATQKKRILPVIEALAAEGWPVALSVDTRHSDVAAHALDCGAHIINDICGLADRAMVALIAGRGCTAIVMHMRGTPATMSAPDFQRYDDVVADVKKALQQRLDAARCGGVTADQIWVDPGLGFAKTAAQSWQLTAHLATFVDLGYPVVYGASRKAFLDSALKTIAQHKEGPNTAAAAKSRDAATAAVCAVAVAAGAKVVRVHNVAAVKDAVAVGWALYQASRPT